MVPRLAKLVLVVVLACALIGSGGAPGLPEAMAATAPPGMTIVPPHGHNCNPAMAHARHSSPAKPQLPGCMSDLGCLLVVGIPVAPVRVGTPLSHGRIAWSLRSETVRGITREPAIGPPIHPV